LSEGLLMEHLACDYTTKGQHRLVDLEIEVESLAQLIAGQYELQTGLNPDPLCEADSPSWR